MVYMVVWGAGMLAGANAGAWVVDRNLDLAALMALAGSAVAMLVFPYLLHSDIALLVDVFVVPAFVNALGPALQTRLMDFAGMRRRLRPRSIIPRSILPMQWGCRGSFLLARQFGYGALGWGGALFSVGGLIVYLFALIMLKRRADA